MSIEKQLGERLAKIGAAPFLFVGAGLSRRYANLETWEQLLRRYSEGLPQPYEYYAGQAARNLPRTATLLADAFYERWWREPAFEESRTAFKGSVVDNASCLKYEISKYLVTQDYTKPQNETLAAEIDLLKRATVDGIITTNWDMGLESIFPDFAVYVGQESILFSTSQGIAEIYKIHGCATQPNSLVLTTNDYESFNNRNPYLAAKLMTTFVEHPVIFLGYSLSDENVTSILRQIASCLTNENIGKLIDRLIFVQLDTEQRGDSMESSVTQVDGRAIPVTIIRTNDFSQVYRPLGAFQRRLPARLLRNIKEHIYELVRTNDPKGQLAVLNIEDAKTFENLEVVFGIGVVSKIGLFGYKPLTRFDLYRDVVAEKSQYNAVQLIRDTLPGLLRGKTRNVPIFRYLREAGLIEANGGIVAANLHHKVVQAARSDAANFYPPKSYAKERFRIQRELQTLARVIEVYDPVSHLYVPFLEPEQIVAAELRAYILERLQDKELARDTYFCRLICFYDWVVNGPHVKHGDSPVDSFV